MDLTPEHFDAGRRGAAAEGVELEWVEGDAEALAFDDDTFDVVTLVGRDVANRAVAMLGVVPLHKPSDPLPCCVDACEDKRG